MSRRPAAALDAGGVPPVAGSKGDPALPAPRARGTRASAPAPRHDGFTPARQRLFLETLADTASVRDAARAVGISPTTAYRRRAEPDADAFRLAWAAALAHAFDRLADTAFDRAVNGVEEDVLYHGEVVGTRTRYNARLLMFLLRRRGEYVPVHTRIVDGRRTHEELFDSRSFALLLGRVSPAGPGAGSRAGSGAEALPAPHAFTSSLSDAPSPSERPSPAPVDGDDPERKW